ncbi:MAG TPA: hypothetical protein VEV17_10715 [Bryobacteraceae bacterium]|nr:hypothetical protein [Bryobacteraceae bacterium]
MKWSRMLLATAAIAAALAQNNKPAPKPKPQVGEIRATGCVRLAQNGCILLKTLDGATTYTFEAAPKPEAGAVITIQGAAHRGPTPCRQGLAVDVADWVPTGEKCVE